MNRPSVAALLEAWSLPADRGTGPGSRHQQPGTDRGRRWIALRPAARGPASLTSCIPGDHPARDRPGLELAGSALGGIVWRAGRWRAGHAAMREVADRLREGAHLDTVADRVRLAE